MKKQISIKELKINSFKGVKALTINFDSQTNIFGANGTGKTTVFDAFTWLLFGKDSNERKDFNVKTLDKTGKSKPMVECEVSAILIIDGQETTLRRILKEDWVTKRGTGEKEFKGNTTNLYWNEVPMTVTEFTRKVNEVVDETVFKIITSPTFFTSMDWKKQREILIQLVGGEGSDAELAQGNEAYEALVANLTQGKTLKQYEDQIKASVKKAKDDLKMIPARIDEVERGKPEAKDFRVLEIELEGYQNQLTKVDAEIADANKAVESALEEIKTLKVSANNVKVEIETIETAARTEANDRLKPNTSVLDGLVKDKQAKEQELESFKNGLTTLESKKSGIEAEIKSIEGKMEAKRNEWNTENAKELTFNDNDFHCPTCKREFESGDVESKKSEMLATFKANKQKALAEINAAGVNLKAQKEALENELKTVDGRIETGKTTIEEAQKALNEVIGKIEIENQNNSSDVAAPSFESVYESLLSFNEKYQEKLVELDGLNAMIKAKEVTPNNSELSAKRQELVTVIDQIKSELLTKAEIEKAEARIQQLKDEEQELIAQVANVEKIQFTIESFIKSKMDRIEDAVNGLFKMVQFKMFNEQINGGMAETCEAMVNGVPYSDVNTASKINAGLDIINTLCEFYGVTAPIFIDNRESVSELIDTDSQIISLIVSPKHKQLTPVADGKVEEYQSA